MNAPRFDLSLDELLCDPVTQAVMRADGIDSSVLRAQLIALGRAIDTTAGRAPARPGFVRAMGGKLLSLRGSASPHRPCVCGTV